MKKWIFLINLIGISSLYGFEVNTHQALTRCAITTECNNNGGTANLDTFVKNTELSKYNNYDRELFEKYTKKDGTDTTYKHYIEEAEDAIKNYQVTTTGDYKGMIEAGSILEDAVHHNALASFDGRFNNHFYAGQLNSKLNCTKERLTASGVAVLMGKPIVGVVGGTVLLGDTALMKTNKALCNSEVKSYFKTIASYHEMLYFDDLKALVIAVSQGEEIKFYFSWVGNRWVLDRVI